MKELEKQIGEAADLKYTRLSANPPYCEIKDMGAIRGFVEGVKSETAKQYWQQGMYSEEEVKRLFEIFKIEFSLHRNIQVLNCDFERWFEQNKKK